MERILEPPTGLAAKWLRSCQLAEVGNQAGASFTRWDEVSELERQVLLGRIKSFDDAIAKLKAVRRSFADGSRTDGADAEALEQTICWLGGHRNAGRIDDAHAA